MGAKEQEQERGSYSSYGVPNAIQEKSQSGTGIGDNNAYSSMSKAGIDRIRQVQLL